MKQNSIISIICIIILVGVLTMLFVKRTDSSVVKLPNTVRENLETNKIFFFENYTRLVVASDGEKINEDIVLKDTATNVYTIGKLVKRNKKILVFRYAYNDCDKCISFVYTNIIRLIKDKNRVLIINSPFSERDFKVKTKAQKFAIPQFSLKNSLSTLGLQIEGHSLPFLFVLDESNTVSKIHIPFKELPSYTEEYLNYINAYLEKK